MTTPSVPLTPQNEVLPFMQTILDNSVKYAQETAYNVHRQGSWHKISWQQFRENIAHTASAFMANAITSNDLVALYAPNCPEWTEIDYACMSRKIVTVAVHATSSIHAVGQMLRETQPAMVFVGNAQLADNVLQNSDCRNLVILEGTHPQCRTFQEFLDSAPAVAPDWSEPVASTLPQDLWTIVYTSGTTGDVRGAMLTHGNILHQIKAHVPRLPDVHHGDSSFCLLPLSHIFERGWSAIQYAWGMTQNYCHIDPQAVERLREAAPNVVCTVPRVLEKIYAAIKSNFSQRSAFMQRVIDWSLAQGMTFENLRLEKRRPSLSLKLCHKLADKLVLSKVRDVFGGRLKHCVVGSASLETKIHEFFRACGIFLNCGYGLTETTATISSSLLGESIPSTVGMPMEGLQIRLGQDNEIQVKGPTIMQGYYKQPEATANVFTEDGFFRTGDVGEIAPNGYLRIVDRLKDMIRTSTGKYVAPQYLENKLSLCPLVEQAAVVGEGRSWLGALLVPNFTKLEELARELKISFSNREELINMPEIVKAVKTQIDDILRDVGRHEKVQQIALLLKPFTVESGELTPTLKLRRKVIYDHYQSLIKAMDEQYIKLKAQLTPNPSLVQV